jgi:hypothetical protein
MNNSRLSTSSLSAAACMHLSVTMSGSRRRRYGIASAGLSLLVAPLVASKHLPRQKRLLTHGALVHLAARTA